MDLTLALHHISEELDSRETCALKFLCKDLVPRRRLEAVKDARDLFGQLRDQAHLAASDALIVAELLVTLRRYNLLRKLGMDRKGAEGLLSPASCKISAYRKFLYELSEDVTDDNLTSIKFLLNLPHGTLDLCKNFLDILTEMEKGELLSEDNLQELEHLCQQFNQKLASKVHNFANRRGNESMQSTGNSTVYSLSSSTEASAEMNHTGSELGSSLNSEDLSEIGGSVVSPDAVSTNKDGFYSMSHRPRGLCLIINNERFYDRKKNRPGTEEDAAALKKVFSELHFEVEERKDLTSCAMQNVVKEFGKKDHSELDAFVCCVLSHGEQGTVLGTDCKTVSIRALASPFTSVSCPSLAGKPKIFFIQACQGHDKMSGLKISSGQRDDSYETDDTGDTHPFLIPNDCDFLIGMATVQQYKSFRNKSTGSIYIQELCRQLMSGCRRNEDILSILIQVNRTVSEGDYMNAKQMPEPRYTLTKKLFLPF